MGRLVAGSDPAHPRPYRQSRVLPPVTCSVALRQSPWRHPAPLRERIIGVIPDVESES